MDKTFIENNLDGLIILLVFTENNFSVTPVFDDKDVEIDANLQSSLEYLKELIDEQHKKHPKDCIDFIKELATPHVEQYSEKVEIYFESNSALEYFIGMAIHLDIDTMFCQSSFMVRDEAPDEIFNQQFFDVLQALTTEMFLNISDDVDSSFGVLHQRIAPTFEFHIERESNIEVA